MFQRFKVETQLLSWLQKYDLEMSDKQVELDEFTQKHEEELEKCAELEVIIYCPSNFEPAGFSFGEYKPFIIWSGD